MSRLQAPQVVRPADVARLRNWMLEQWAPGGFLRTQAYAYTSSKFRDIPGTQHPQLAALRHGTLWWVSPDMCDVLESAMKAIPEDTTLDDLTPCSPTGLVVFGRTLRCIDAATGSHDLPVDCYAWGPGFFAESLEDKAAFTVVFWSFYVADRDVLSERHEYLMAHRDKLKDPTAILEANRALAAALGATGRILMPLGHGDWPLDTTTTGRSVFTTDTGAHAAASSAEDRRLMAALWALLTQPGLCGVEDDVADRPVRRVSARVGAVRPLEPVKVITLRRARHEGTAATGGDEPRRYSHRWMVQGHWRWQPHGPGRTQRKLIWVRPHIKGPEDAPLHAPPKVNALVR